VASVLDLGYFTYPQAYTRADVLYMRTAIPGSFRRAAALLAISEHTRQDIIQLFPFVKDKVTVTYLAATGQYRKISDRTVLDDVRNKYDLQSSFIFYAGSISPRKGWPFLLEAFARLKAQQQIPHMLVITGGWRWRMDDLDEAIAKLSLQNHIKVLGNVPIEVMPALYNLADLMVYPSMYEGFGLPVLEAMACGCPVVCSNRTSLPEVAGNAALMVDPPNIAELANAMYAALTDATLRAQMVERGLARAAGFTWEQTARATLAVFEQVGSQA
jgi:glycosyltransferase involved in cell wall biosynthesis